MSQVAEGTSLASNGVATGKGRLRVIPGRPYRLILKAGRAGTGSPSPMERCRLELRCKTSFTASGFFPFPGDGSGWLPPLQPGDHADEAMVEFRAPPDASAIDYELMHADPASAGTLNLRLEPLGPSLPADLLRCLVEPEATGQQPCRVLELGEWSRAVIAPSGGQVTGSSALLPSVAFIGSAELRQELACDCDVVELREEAWRDQLASRRFAYLLVETVLHVDQRGWRYSLTREGRGRKEVEALLAHCRAMGVPVAVWYRVEPTLYPEFAWLANHADFCGGVDDAIQAQLREDHPAKACALLPPAIQPALYNPLRRADQERTARSMAGTVLFDGWWDLSADPGNPCFARLKEDRLLVVESEWEFSCMRRDQLPAFRWNVLGCLDAGEKATLSRLVGAELFLDHPTNAAWRRQQAMLRSAACGSVVIHPSTAGPSPLAQQGLCWEGPPNQLPALLEVLVDHPLRRAQWCHRVTRDILARHCLADRLQQIAEAVGSDACFVAGPPAVACVLVSMRPWLVPAAIERYRRDRYPAKELIVVIHDPDADMRALRGLVHPGERIRMFQMGRERSLGTCLNFALDQTDAPYWAKFDDDDFYGPEYLSDMLLYRRIVDFSVLGKAAAFIYLEGHDELLLNEPRVGRANTVYPSSGAKPGHVAGGSLVGRRDVVETVPFSERRRGGSDSDFLVRLHEAGHDLVAADPFNFAYFRSTKAGFHTWNTTETELRRNTRAVGGGAAIETEVFI